MHGGDHISSTSIETETGNSVLFSIFLMHLKEKLSGPRCSYSTIQIKYDGLYPRGRGSWTWKEHCSGNVL